LHRDKLLPRLQKAICAGAAGFDVRQVGAGYWIALQDLSSDRAAEVVKTVEEKRIELREAPFLVLDLRGNRGGSSGVGRQIAASLLGTDFVDSRLGGVESSDCGNPDGAWRTSPGNIRNLEYLIDNVTLLGGSDTKKLLTDLLSAARTARVQGKEFSGPIICPSGQSRRETTTQPSLMKGRLILLTDNFCFSSCLAVAGDFRTLGAFHVGQTTDAATHFVEVREEYLPSGYSIFSTLQALDPSAPAQVGPFQPALTYNQDIADSAALQSWVVSTALPASAQH
jgi:Peptidase family S41